MAKLSDEFSQPTDDEGLGQFESASADARGDSTPPNTLVDGYLRRVIDRWPDLPAAIRAGILAMVNA